MNAYFRISLYCLVALWLLSGSNCFAAESPPVALPKGIITLDGRQAPALQLSDMDGGLFTLGSNENKWKFVHFWASWCGPCRREMPLINKIHGQFEDSHLQIILVNTAENEDTVFSFMGIVAPELNPLLDRDGQVTEKWQPRGLPATFFVDPKGKLRFLALGGRAWDEPDYLRFLKQLENVKY